MEIVGYARVSSVGQSLKVQLDKLKDCHKIFQERHSAKSNRSERQIDGINKAKERGVLFGRKHTITDEQVTELRKKRKNGVFIKTLMKDYNLSKASIYRYLKPTEPADF